MRTRTKTAMPSGVAHNSSSAAVGRSTLTQRHASRAPATERAILDAAWAPSGPIQLDVDQHSELDEDEVRAAARHGTAGAGEPLPHLDAIQRSFGPHDLTGVRAHFGPDACDANAALGANAYTTGEHVAFAADSPSLHLAAHEAAHVVQQRGGVQLSSAVGQASDSYEQHADEVANKVVRGESAAELLGRPGEIGTTAVQRKPSAKQRAGYSFIPSISVEDATATPDGYAFQRGSHCVVRLRLVGMGTDPKQVGLTFEAEQRHEGTEADAPLSTFEIEKGGWDGNDIVWVVRAGDVGTTTGVFRLFTQGLGLIHEEQIRFTGVAIAPDQTIGDGRKLVEHAFAQIFRRRQRAVTDFKGFEGLEDPKEDGGVLPHLLAATISFATTAIGAYLSSTTLGLGGVLGSAMSDFIKDGIASAIEAGLQAAGGSKQRMLLQFQEATAAALDRHESISLGRLTTLLSDRVEELGGDTSRAKVIAAFEAAVQKLEQTHERAYAIQLDEMTQAWATALARSEQGTRADSSLAGGNATDMSGVSATIGVDTGDMGYHAAELSFGGSGILGLEVKLGKPGKIVGKDGFIGGLNEELTGRIGELRLDQLHMPRHVVGRSFELDELQVLIAGKGDVIGYEPRLTDALVDLTLDENGALAVGGLTTFAGRVWLIRTVKPEIDAAYVIEEFHKVVNLTQDEELVSAGGMRLVALLSEGPIKDLW